MARWRAEAVVAAARAFPASPRMRNSSCRSVSNCLRVFSNRSRSSWVSARKGRVGSYLGPAAAGSLGAAGAAGAMATGGTTGGASPGCCCDASNSACGDPGAGGRALVAPALGSIPDRRRMALMVSAMLAI